MLETSEVCGAYKVVINSARQYSIWPVERSNPTGWRDVGIEGSKGYCLAYIDKVWKDIRPSQLVKKPRHSYISQKNVNGEIRRIVTSQSYKLPNPGRPDDLVDRLCRHPQTFEVILRPQRGVRNLLKSLNRGYLHMKTLGEKAGIKLAVRITEFAIGGGLSEYDEMSTVKFSGRLVLNFCQIHVRAEMRLGDIRGHGKFYHISHDF